MKLIHPAGCVIAAGVVAALHVAKLPPALPVLQQLMGVSLLQAGFLLSLVQLAGMALGLPAGLLIQRWGPRRSVLTGLLLLAGASTLGGAAPTATVLLLSRALEGLGFLCVVLPAPGLLRVLVPPGQLSRVLGGWGAYMPLGAALALLAGPAVMALADAAWGWRLWWWGLSALAVLLAGLVLVRVPADVPAGSQQAGAASPPWRALLKLTLRSRGAWSVALSFAMYSGQWMAVVGFLPSIYAQAGLAPATTAWLTALAAGVNIIGNLAAGRLLHRGVAPVALLATGFVAMALGTLVAFGVDGHPQVQYLAVLVFSMIGGLIPGTLFSLTVRLAPGLQTVPTTVGWVQQWSAVGQFCGPPLVAWVAAQAGHWQWTWVVTGACSVAGLFLAWQIRALLHRP
ncbi:MFS transporter [Polaromonas eurypsychrophila]|uniref:MFS transporter n=1 Tax=Polaromonas eurypsychrophila TaxID=1614635 RepID=A0A916SBC5_9BURK|nr:MFS transporter [Polaromonas eurypsychrophila]GGA92704.1 MFS transporter [Polaromonas eurypsychrophila]